MRVQKTLRETACFTGHRKLERPERELEMDIFEQIQRAVMKGYTHFICGGALGFDMLAAEQVICYREQFKRLNSRPIALEIAIPCKDHTARWSYKQKARFNAILECADTKNEPTQEYTKECMQLRNQYMVSRSSLIIAYYTGEKGGTKNTLDYAKKEGREIWYIK